MNFTINRANSIHADAISKIERNCFKLPRTAETLQRQIECENYLFLTALTLDNIVIGYCDLQFVLDEGYIGNVAVSPEYRRKGIADALINEMIQQKKSGLSFITLEVRASNTCAISLYEKHSFQKIGIQKNHYEQPREDAILMTLFFNNTEVTQ